jgi:hypothetical protein
MFIPVLYARTTTLSDPLIASFFSLAPEPVHAVLCNALASRPERPQECYD